MIWILLGIRARNSLNLIIPHQNLLKNWCTVVRSSFLWNCKFVEKVWGGGAVAIATRITSTHFYPIILFKNAFFHVLLSDEHFLSSDQRPNTNLINKKKNKCTNIVVELYSLLSLLSDNNQRNLRNNSRLTKARREDVPFYSFVILVSNQTLVHRNFL